MSKKFLKVTTRGTERQAITAFMRRARKNDIHVVRFSIVPEHPLYPGQEKANFIVTALEAHANL